MEKEEKRRAVVEVKMKGKEEKGRQVRIEGKRGRRG